MPTRHLKELLRALDVSEASVILFGLLPGTGPQRTSKPPPVADAYLAFSNHSKLEVTLQECEVLRAAGAKDGRPFFPWPNA